MTIPLARYLHLTAENRWIRLGLLCSIPCFLVAVLGTYSRGAVVGLAVTAIALLTKSRHRMRLALIAGLTLVAAVQFMPEHWHARIASIADYEEDAAAQGRLEAWRYAVEVAHDSPVVGGGFNVVRAAGRDAHSIYFEALAEHGYVGLTIFLALCIGTYMTARSIRRRAGEHPDLAWAADLASMVQVSIVAYSFAGLFLTLATFDLFYHLVAIVVIASKLVRQSATSGLSAASTERAESYERPADARA